VDTREQQDVLFDDVIGAWFAVMCWNNNPREILGAKAFADWQALGAKLVAARPLTQLHWDGDDDPDVTVVGDRTGQLKAWFDAHQESVLFLRPDRCIAGACIAQLCPELCTSLFDVLTLTPGGNRVASPVLYVPQPSAQSARAVAGPP
jgi:3-(3-hydroxy-phenyl)propionate hydroxylase